MEIAQIKQMSIEMYLDNMGITPSSRNKSKAWYYSPFRKEKTPSFVLNLKTNRWYDFGEGIGGSILDLVMRLQSIDFKTAMEKLQKNDFEKSYFLTPISASEFSKKHRQSEGIKIFGTKPIYSYSLKNYLRNRGIPLPIAAKYLEEVNYMSVGRYYFSLGFKNDSGGYELRNQLPKGKVSSFPKDITTILNQESNDLAIFEGFFDFLSACVYYQKSQLPYNVIIMNSISMKGKTLEKAKKYNKVFLFLDNDPSGKQTTQFFLDYLIDVKDMAPEIYPAVKDFNDFLLYTKPKGQ